MVLLTEIPKGGFSGEDSELILKCLQDNQVEQTVKRMGFKKGWLEMVLDSMCSGVVSATCGMVEIT